MKLLLLTGILLMMAIHCRSQNDMRYIMEFKKIKGDQLSFTGTYKDSLVWQLLVSLENKFKIKKELVPEPGFTYENHPLISQFGFVGTLEVKDDKYILTFNFPKTDTALLERVFNKNNGDVKIIDDKTVVINKGLQTIWINDTMCKKDKSTR